MVTVAIIPAAGKGKRMAYRGGVSKPYLTLGNKPLLAHTLSAFEGCDLIKAIVVVVSPEEEVFCRREVIDRFGFKKVIRVIPGGEERQDSVRAGLNAIDDHWELVVVHDGVRPFVTPTIIERAIEVAKGLGASIVAVPVKDTIKEVTRGVVLKTLSRDGLWIVQTPQVFRQDILKEAHRKALEDGFIGTDDSTLVERLGYKVAVVEGSYDNIKITTLEDLVWGEAILRQRRKDSNLESSDLAT